MEPLIFEPLLKRIRWGGRRLGDCLQKPIGNETDYAESWEIADQPDGRSVVATGRFAGHTLQQLIEAYPAELLGRQQLLKQFPLLIKFLDANDWLSLQVHPDDEQAVRYNPDERGKTEAWVILEAEPDSQICAGLKAGVTRDEFQQRLQNGTIEACLHMLPARVGEVVFVPARTVHALGPGILLAEIQQQSNLTFRVHDWGRVGADGQPRQIHVEQALACTDFDRGPVNPVEPQLQQENGHRVEKLVCCDHFVIRRHTGRTNFTIDTDNRFRILMNLQGSAAVQTDGGEITLQHGQTALVPAINPAIEVQPQSESVLLEVSSP
jgi:mannose-6-phosphate isomerase